MVPHMIHIATCFALVCPARNYLRARDPLQQGMLSCIARTAMSLLWSAHAVNYSSVQPEASKSNKNVTQYKLCSFFSPSCKHPSHLECTVENPRGHQAGRMGKAKVMMMISMYRETT